MYLLDARNDLYSIYTIVPSGKFCPALKSFMSYNFHIGMLNLRDTVYIVSPLSRTTNFLPLFLYTFLPCLIAIGSFIHGVGGSMVGFGASTFTTLACCSSSGVFLSNIVGDIASYACN